MVGNVETNINVKGQAKEWKSQCSVRHEDDKRPNDHGSFEQLHLALSGQHSNKESEKIDHAVLRR